MTADVVVVGGRVAGAALATRLARAGASVVLLDAAPLHSDQPSSTHLIQPPGMDELDALGLGHAVRAPSPALTHVRFDFDGCSTRLAYGDGRAAHCLRRHALDPPLQDAAAHAGVDVQGESRLSGLDKDGVEVHRRDGRVQRIQARLVVGADGRHSTVGRLVGAREYLGYDGPRACYWAYWRRPAHWDAHAVENLQHGDDMHVVFPTDDDLLLIATSPFTTSVAPWRADHNAAYLADIAGCPAIAERLDTDGRLARCGAWSRAGTSSGRRPARAGP